jgi:alpha-ketoglutarate-dependent 2,4-dichlorophenoxyacetate dioxygenase
MTIAVRQIHPVFVGEMSGIDISKPLSPDEVSAIEAGIDRYAVLVFHDQKITDEQQMAFSRNFGNLEDARGGNITKPEDKRLQVGMNDVSNLDRDGQPLTRESRVRLFNLGNMLWHSDSSFRAIPAKYSLLSARVVNPVGGNTEFADMRAAYDTLDADTKALIAELICEHSLMYSRGSLGMLDYSDEERDVPAGAPVSRAHASGERAEVALSLVSRRRHCRHADPRGAYPAPGSERACHPAEVRLRPHLEPLGSRHVGQPPGDAPRAPLRREPAARHAPYHGRRQRPDHRASSVGVAATRGDQAGPRSVNDVASIPSR